MRCFQHFEREALGSCVGCGKGVCLDCLNKVEGRIYCSGCESPATGGLSVQVNGVTRLSMRQSSPMRQSMGTPHFNSTTLYSNKNRFFAALLAFCAGTFGVHKFYVGETGWGFMYLLFCWTGFPSLAGFVEGILYVLRSDDDFIRRYGQPMLASQPGVPLMTSSVKSLPATPKEYEKFLLQFAMRHEGQISMAHLLTETELKPDKVEDALARLSAKGVVVSDIDDNGFVRYYVPEFRPR